MWFFIFFLLIYICGKKNDYLINGVRLEGYPFGKNEVRGLPHTKTNMNLQMAQQAECD